MFFRELCTASTSAHLPFREPCIASVCTFSLQGIVHRLYVCTTALQGTLHRLYECTFALQGIRHRLYVCKSVLQRTTHRLYSCIFVSGNCAPSPCLHIFKRQSANPRPGAPAYNLRNFLKEYYTTGRFIW
jgi:hypothetical protein